MDDFFNNDNEYSLEEMILDVVSQLYFVRPGIIKTFDADRNVVEVQVAIKGKRVVENRVEYITHPVIKKVPVVTPYSFGADVCLTVPIKPGDPCLLLFSDRMMDNFLRTGIFSLPEAMAGDISTVTEPRQHDMADAICLPGLITQKVGSASGLFKDWSNDAIELRNRDRTKYISIGPGGIELFDGAARQTMRSGRVAIDAPQGFYVHAPNVAIDDATGDANIRGAFKADDLKTAPGFSANNHRHGNVQSGNSITSEFV